MNIADEVRALVETRGAGEYFGEPVSVGQHGLQAAHFARLERADETLVAAALLHDVGHLLDEAPSDIADWHADARHERIGGEWLARRFGPAVSDPVRLHVAAKRYLCTVSPGYLARLSPASVLTFGLQGGPMSAGEAESFRGERYFREALRVRLWDDRAKVPGLAVAGIAEYLPFIVRLAGHWTDRGPD